MDLLQDEMTQHQADAGELKCLDVFIVVRAHNLIMTLVYGF